jgi:peptidoglycan/LPS O-acetylase OafA/YrhL
VHILRQRARAWRAVANTRQTRELSSLTALRGLAALAVLIFHRGVNFGGVGGPLGTAIGHGYLAVDLFFVISGFVLNHVYGRTFADFGWADILSFLWARFARIYPVHVVTLILLLPFYGNQGFSGAALAENLLFIQIFLAPMLTWNDGAWSISAEWYAYLLFPFIVIPLLDRTGRMTAVRIIGLCLASPAVLIINADTGNIAGSDRTCARPPRVPSRNASLPLFCQQLARWYLALRRHVLIIPCDDRLRGRDSQHRNTYNRSSRRAAAVLCP